MADHRVTTIKNEKVAVVGSGLIGRSFAMFFASAGYQVAIYDILPEQITAALENIKVMLVDLESKGLLRGTLNVAEQFARISGTNSLQEAVTGAFFVQECVPERMELKISVFKQIDEWCSDTAILSSSTSSMPISSFTQEIKHKEQAIVSHPCNPPFYTPLMEVCPAPHTRPEVTERTMELMKEVGQVPVLIKKELFGFVLNRLQYALMNECYRLVEDEVVSVHDLDTVMKDGLGMRYAFVGPLQACHLNAEGMENYCERYGETITTISENFGPNRKWGGETGVKINAEMESVIPTSQLIERRRWRDARLAALASIKNNMASGN